MSIFKKPNSRFWWYAVRNGEKYLRGSTGTENADIARAVEQTIRSAYKRTAPADRLHAVIDALVGVDRKSTDGLLLAGVWGEYERHVRTVGKKLKPITLDQRRQRCCNFATWAKSNRTACETAEQVDRSCAAAYADFLEKKKTSGKTRANIINDLGAIWEGLSRVRDGVTANPWRKVVPETHDSQRGKAFSVAEELAVIKAADAAGHGWGLACRISRHTGLRYGDIARLTWERVSLEQREIALEPSKTDRHRISVRIPITQDLFDALSEAKRAAPFAKQLFPQLESMLKNRHTEYPFATVLKSAGLEGKGYTFHSWRHTFRTRLAAAGVSKDTAKRLGGWTEDATADRYDHADHIAELRAAVDAGALQSRQNAG